MEGIRLLLSLLGAPGVATQIILILSFMTIFIGLLNTWNKYLETRLQREKLAHERQSWKLNLLIETEKMLTEKRMMTYPEVMEILSGLSRFNMSKRSGSDFHETANRLQAIAYGEAGTFMDADTRQRVIMLRDLVHELGDALKQGEPTTGMKNDILKARTDVTERLRRDLSMSSFWRPELVDYLTLTENKVELQPQGFFGWLLGYKQRRGKADK